jgi:hypothetical protein
MGQKAARPQSHTHTTSNTSDATNPNFDPSRAEAILPLLSQLLGLSPSQNPSDTNAAPTESKSNQANTT